MKKFLLLLTWVGIIGFTSCSHNEEPTQVSGEKVKVQFNISALGVDVMPISRASAKDVLTQIECKIYNVNTFQTSTISQTIGKDAERFGIITAWLSPGTYQIGIIGAGNDGSGDDMNLNAVSLSRSNHGTFNARSYDKDAFGFSKTFSVSDVPDIETNITLDRYVGKLCVQIDGELPEFISRVELSFDHRLWVSLSDFRSSEIEGRNEVLKDLNISDGNLAEYTRFITPGEANVRFLTYDNDGKQINATDVHVNIYSNKRTIIRGKVENLLNQTPFEISVNDTWDSDVIVPLQ